MDTSTEASTKARKVGAGHKGPLPSFRDNPNPQPKQLVLQHEGLKITTSEDESIKISNRKLIHQLLVAHGLENGNTTQEPYQIGAGLNGSRGGEAPADKSAHQIYVGVLRFVAKTRHPAIEYILGMLGRHLHNPANRHADAIKSVLRYMSLRFDDGPVYKPNIALTLTFYTDTDHAPDIETRLSIACLLCLLAAQPIVWISARQATVTRTSTEFEYIGIDTGAKVTTRTASLA